MRDVLITDESEICRELLGHILEMHGFAAIWSSPRDAPEIMRTTPVPLLILEPGPIGSKGWLLLASLRGPGKAGKGPAVIIMTDQCNKHEVLRAAKLGVREYMLKKRFSLAELLTRVRRHVVPSLPIPERRNSSHSTVSASPMAITPGRSQNSAAPAPVQRIQIPLQRGPQHEDRKTLLAAANDLKLKLHTREETLERLEAAPVKTLPGVVAELISLVNSPRGTVSDIAQILRRDAVMTARVLRVANSAGFATQRARVGTVEDAVKNIGVAGVRNLVVNVGVFDAFATDAPGGLRVTRVWQHCLGVAMLMEKLAPEDPSIPPGSAYLVGLCHDLADIVLRQHFTDQYEAIGVLAEHCHCSPHFARNVVFGMNYAELVSQLLARLHLPPIITVPIEEFFDRGTQMGAAGSGSLLGRTLRALNVYAHGLLLAPGIDEPITPLTRTECQNTFGDISVSESDDDVLRGEALATAAILGGLTSSQTQQMCEPLVPQRPLRVCYSRHAEYSKLDPLATFLRLAARETVMMPPLTAMNPNLLNAADALIVAGSRSAGADAFEQDLDHIRRLIAGRPLDVLYLAGFDDAPQTSSDGITVRRIPTNLETLGTFLEKVAESKTKGVAAAGVDQRLD